MQIDQILEGLEVNASPFAFCEVRGNGRFTLKEDEQTSIHYVLSGEGVAWQVTGIGVDLPPHTVMIIPPGTSIAITCNRDGNWLDPEPECTPLTEEMIDIKVGEGDQRVYLACAFLTARHMQTSGLFDYLHEPMVLDVSAETSFREPFDRLLRELAAQKPGSRALAELLMRQCLIALLRRQSDPNGEFSGPWLAAVTNPALGRAIAAILDQPEKHHTLQTLAETAGMSRTAFADQFKGLTGRTPIEFLREVRLRRATRLLTSTDLPIKTISARVGFDSRSYFSKAFKAFTGTDPVSFRHKPIEFLPPLEYVVEED